MKNLAKKYGYFIIVWLLGMGLVIKMARKDGTKIPPIILFWKMKRANGCAFLRYVIVLNSNTLRKRSRRSIMKTVIHEYRHTWQYIHYERLYVFWMHRDHKEIYKRYYKTSLCSIEEDARCFARTGGQASGSSTLKSYHPALLDRWYQRGLL